MIKVNEITNNIYQIRVIDKNAKNFHGCLYPVKDGTSYACYLIIDEYVTLIDTVDDIYFEDVLNVIKEILDNKNIDNVIINHVEPDHSGSFALLMKEYPKAKVYTSKAGIKAMQHQFFKEYDYTQVGLNDSLKIGSYTLSFFETPLVHWPDNMWTFLHEESILFSNDAFGQLLVDDVVYDDELGLDKLLDYSKEYYANIVWANNVSVANTFKKFDNLDWDIKVIAPAHGIMIKSYINDILNQYKGFVQEPIKKKALVVYETIWNNTEMMSNEVASALKSLDYEVKVYKLSDSLISEIIKEMIDTKIVCIGTSNYNNCILPTVVDFVERLRAAHFNNRKAIVFGSYGWSPVTFKTLTDRLVEAKFDVSNPAIVINYTPDEDDKKMIKSKIIEYLK